MWHLHDHAETTLKDDNKFARIRSDNEYEISFRARWLSGCPLLNTRLYFNRLSQTHVRPQPSSSGTPGARNSVYEESIGPVYRNLIQEPLRPNPNEPVQVSVHVSDPDDVDEVTLHWSGGESTMI